MTYGGYTIAFIASLWAIYESKYVLKLMFIWGFIDVISVMWMASLDVGITQFGFSVIFGTLILICCACIASGFS